VKGSPRHAKGETSVTVIETERLALRELTADDAAFIVELLNDPSFLRYIGDRGVRTIDDARRYIETGPRASYAQHGFGLYLVERRAGRLKPAPTKESEPAPTKESEPAPTEASEPAPTGEAGEPRGEAMGICGLLKREALPDADVGFAFLPRFWRRGYALESASAVLARGREVHGLSRVLAITSPDNEASIALLARLGFTFERRARLSEGATPVNIYSLKW
jgi:RimJ/RimL family protein N-acetyltransferase